MVLCRERDAIKKNAERKAKVEMGNDGNQNIGFPRYAVGRQIYLCLGLKFWPEHAI